MNCVRDSWMTASRRSSRRSSSIPTITPLGSSWLVPWTCEGERERALAEVRAVLEREPSHPDAAALLDWLGGRRRPASGVGPRPDLRRPEGS
jgi:hypothetical protein